MTEPLTPPDLDLRDFPYMPLDVVRLRDSDLAVVASGDEFRTAVILWCASWHQVPAASLPTDDRLLASLAGFGRDLKGWKAVREAALRGFITCSDGRLYHPVIAEKAIEAGTKRRNQRGQTAAATEARRLAKELRDAELKAQRDAERNVERDVQRNDDRYDSGNAERDVHQGKGSEGKGPESNRIEKTERGSLSVVKDSGKQGDGPWPIDDNYQPSEPAIEYAYSLGMKKADLNSELSKFAADGMALRKVSFDLDASFKKRCDQWFDYQRRNAPKAPASAAGPVRPEDLTPAFWDSAVKRWKSNESLWPRGVGGEPGMVGCKCPANILVANMIDPASGRGIFAPLVWISEGSIEMGAYCHNAGIRNVKPPTIFEIEEDGVVKRGAYVPKIVPDGYDSATGERIPPANSEVSAA